MGYVVEVTLRMPWTMEWSHCYYLCATSACEYRPCGPSRGKGIAFVIIASAIYHVLDPPGSCSFQDPHLSVVSLPSLWGKGSKAQGGEGKSRTEWPYRFPRVHSTCKANNDTHISQLRT